MNSSFQSSNLYLERPGSSRSANQRSALNIENFNNQKSVSLLTGKPIDMTHNNMIPFFGGSIKQNVNAANSNQHVLERHTGESNLGFIKKEQSPLFQPQKSMSYVYGTPNTITSQMNRYIPSDKKTNELPAEKIQVGPGINQGYTWKPSGGFQQQDSRPFALPKTVDDLRVLTNPKISYKGRVISGKYYLNNRTSLPNISKRRPDRYYENSPARYNTTVGANTKSKIHPKPILKKTNTRHIESYIGNMGNHKNDKERIRPEIRKSRKVTFENDGPRNLDAQGTNSDPEKFDYGKKNINLGTNQRDITGIRTHVTNITKIVKEIIAPIQDLIQPTKKDEQILNARMTGNLQVVGNEQLPVYDPNDTPKTTIKETNIHDNRTGNMQMQAPSRVTIYDPNDVTRTTIKETNIHNNRQGNLNGPVQLTVYDPNDVARTTIKETNIHDNRAGNLTGATRVPVYDPNDTAKTTIKETNIHNNRTGNLSGKTKVTVYDPNDIARTTIKETNIHDNHTGNLTGSTRVPVYDPNDTARTTIKETNIHDNHTGNLTASTRVPVYDPNDIARTTIKETNIHDNHTGNLTASTRVPVYDPNDIARTTIKETNIHDNHTGNLSASIKVPVYDPNDVAKTTIKETNIDNNRLGNMEVLRQGGLAVNPDDSTRVTTKETLPQPSTNRNMDGNTKPYVYDPNDIAKTTIKETNINNNRTGNVTGQEGGDGYLVTNTEAPNTNRQFTSDHEYTGAQNGQVGRGDGQGYLTTNTEAPNTNRQFTSDKEYTGTAMSSNVEPMSYEDVYNATMNEVRELTLEGRKPTDSNVTMTNGSDTINMETKKLEGDYMNQRKPVKTNITNLVQDIDECAITNTRDTLNNKELLDRTNPDILDTFKNNPYTQSLHSTA